MTNKTDIQEKMRLYQHQLDEAKKKEAEWQEQKAVRLEQFQGLARDVIKPTMEHFSKEMGHQICRFRIDGDVENEESPQIRCWITPVGISLNEYEYRDVPHVFYIMDLSANELVTNISTIVKGKAGRIYEGATYKLGEVTKDTVEKDLTHMLNELMDNLLSP